MDFSRIKLLVLDVDGVLTDGRIFPLSGDSSAGRFGGKAFHTQDGCAIKLWHETGGISAILSGRASTIVADRAEELGITWCMTGISNKQAGYRTLLEKSGCTDDQTAYIGDDLPDLDPMRRCAFPVAVANATHTMKMHAAYITRRRGGAGAVAETIEYLLRKQHRWAGHVAGESGITG